MHFFPFIKELFSNQAASVLCWTLIHSLWQGLLFVITTGIIMMLTKKSRPALRYKILSIQLLLFVMVPVVTFIWEWNNVPANNGQSIVNTNTALLATSGPALSSQHVMKYQLLETISGFLSRYASLIVLVWFIILLAKSVKIISSLAYTQHLRKHKIHNPSAYWKDKIALLCRQLQITKTVQLLESEIIKVPAVFGHLRPVIFFPLGILANLPPQQIEAVLLHELAHIRRNDYLFNLVQNIIETIFFFNPALLWMSSVIREERENCCDDIAIAQTNDKRQFIESLIRFRELYIYNNSKYVTAFPGNKNSFLNRITRIAMNKNKSLNPAENVFLAISLVIISALVMAFGQIKEPPPLKVVPSSNVPRPPVVPAPPAVIVQTPEMTAPAPLTDTVPKSKKSDQRLDNDDYTVIYSDIDKSAGRETIVLKTGGNEYKVVKLNDEIAYLVVNDEKIPKDKMGDYSDLLKKINAQLERMKEEQKIRDKEQEQRNAEQAIRNKEQEQRNAEQVIRNKQQEQRNAEQVERNEEQEKGNAQQVQQNEEQKRRDAEQLIRNKEQEQRNAEQVIRNKEQEQRNAEQVIRNKQQEQRNAELKKLITDLIDDNIIKEKKGLSSFSLSDDEFIVNGVKQSPEVFKKYKAKYLKLVGGTYNYRYD